MFKILIILSIVIFSSYTMAKDTITAEQAKSLHDKNCSSCHISMKGDNQQFYTRPDRKVDSMKKLKSQVAMCKANLGLQWFDEEVDAVVEHLNSNFYKFE